MILSFWNHQAIMLVWGSVFFDTLKYHKFHETRPPWKMLLFVPQFSGELLGYFWTKLSQTPNPWKIRLCWDPKIHDWGGFSGLFYQQIIEKIFDLEQQKLLQLQKLQYFWWQSEAFCKGRTEKPWDKFRWSFRFWDGSRVDLPHLQPSNRQAIHCQDQHLWGKVRKEHPNQIRLIFVRKQEIKWVMKKRFWSRDLFNDWLSF